MLVCKTLVLGQVQAPISLMLSETIKNLDQPLAFAIVDDTGSMIRYAHMGRCREAPNYTGTPKTYAECLQDQGRTVAVMGNPILAAVQGGMIVLYPKDRGRHRRHRGRRLARTIGCKLDQIGLITLGREWSALSL